MKGQPIRRGLIRGINAVRKLASLDELEVVRTTTTNLPDPEFVKKVKKTRKPRKRLAAPPCTPGTITYRDALVRHLGYDRRAADQLLRRWRAGHEAELPELQKL